MMENIPIRHHLMVDKQNVLIVIPARGGSKGLPGKNIRDLCGKPLIAYTIDAALKSDLADRVVVSTDDPAIAAVALKYGAEVPFLRPPYLGTDRAIVGDAVNHLSRTLLEGGYKADIVVTLYPTHPFRTPALIDYLIGKIIKGYSQVYTGKWVDYQQQSIFYRSNDGCIIPWSKGEKTDPVQVSQDGAYVRLSGVFMGAVCGPLTSAWLHLIDNPISFIDIDYIEDFILAETIIRKGLFDFESKDVVDDHCPSVY